MRSRIAGIALLALAAAAFGWAGDAPSAATENPNDFHVFWKDGLRFRTADGSVELQIGGRFMEDWVVATGADAELEAAVGALTDGTEVRRGRLEMAGKFHHHLEFKLQYDFAGGSASLKDAYLGFEDLGHFGLRLGHFKEPFGLEELTSSKYSTFLEQGLTSTFVPSRNSGLMIHGDVAERVTWSVGAFRVTDDQGKGPGEGETSATGRVTFLPIFADEGRVWVHVGAAYSERFVDDGETVRFSQRPEIHVLQRLVDTGSLAADGVHEAGAELAAAFGPLSFQSEAMGVRVDLPTGRDADLIAYYGYVSVFLTGESRPYKRGDAEVGRVRPRHSLFDGGAGAFELAVRYSHVDLEDQDAGVLGGKLTDYTVGLNWYLNPSSRLMLDWVHPDLDGVGEADLYALRMQFDF